MHKFYTADGYDAELDRYFGEYNGTLPGQGRNFSQVIREHPEAHRVSIHEAAQQIAGREIHALTLKHMRDHPGVDYMQAHQIVLDDPANGDLKLSYARLSGMGS